WAPDRILRLARYTRNQLMYRGQQILGWDSQQQTWYDAFALYMQSGQQQDGDDTYLERYSNNITQMLGDAYVALICRIYPPTIVMPKNARNPEDIQTAKYALDAISVIQRMNKAHDLQETAGLLLYLYGSYFRRTRPVIDGTWAGWDDEPVIEMRAQMKSARY